MKNIYKIISITLVFLMVLSFAGCAKKEEGSFEPGTASSKETLIIEASSEVASTEITSTGSTTSEAVSSNTGSVTSNEKSSVSSKASSTKTTGTTSKKTGTTSKLSGGTTSKPSGGGNSSTSSTTSTKSTSSGGGHWSDGWLDEFQEQFGYTRCSKCGTEMPEYPRNAICPNCGHDENDMGNCPVCGRKLGREPGMCGGGINIFTGKWECGDNG